MQKTERKHYVFGISTILLFSLVTAAGCDRYGIGLEDLTGAGPDDASEGLDTADTLDAETSDTQTGVGEISEEVDSAEEDSAGRSPDTQGTDPEAGGDDERVNTDQCTCVCSCDSDASPADLDADTDTDADADTDTDADADSDTDTDADTVGELDTESVDGNGQTDRDGTECVIISEYLEGSSWNKGIEIFNCGQGHVALEGYSLCVATNDATECSGETALSGQLQAGDVVTVCHTGFENGACDLASGVVNFSGDDRVALFFQGELIDAIGQLSVRPEGNPWADVTMRRCNVEPFSGDVPFELSDFYITADKDDFSDFGFPPSASSCP